MCDQALHVWISTECVCVHKCVFSSERPGVTLIWSCTGWKRLWGTHTHTSASLSLWGGKLWEACWWFFSFIEKSNHVLWKAPTSAWALSGQSMVAWRGQEGEREEPGSRHPHSAALEKNPCLLGAPSVSLAAPPPIITRSNLDKKRVWMCVCMCEGGGGYVWDSACVCVFKFICLCEGFLVREDSNDATAARCEMAADLTTLL